MENNFQDIMRLMNNGRYPNPSTLPDTIPEIVKLGLRFQKGTEILEFVPCEAALNSRVGHEGLDNVVSVCHEVMDFSLEQSKVR